MICEKLEAIHNNSHIYYNYRYFEKSVTLFSLKHEITNIGKRPITPSPHAQGMPTVSQVISEGVYIYRVGDHVVLVR